jgi:hypothetical protein
LDAQKLTDYQKKLLIESYRRQLKKLENLPVLESISSLLFKEQTSFINSPHELASACCTRRSGKSFSCAVGLIYSALKKPSSHCLYIGLTRLSAKAVMQPVIKKILKQFEIHYEYYISELKFILDNGSQIVLTGAGENAREAQKLLGLAYDLVVIDEAQSFPEHLKELIYDVLLITIAERQGKIRVIGTPGIVSTGFFYEIAQGIENNRHWDTHFWSWENNVSIAHLIKEQIDRMVASNPLVIDTPAYKRNYLGMWVADADNLVFRFNPHINCVAFDHETSSQTDCVSLYDFYVLGVDLGYKDATAFVLVGWSGKSPNAYIVSSFKKSGMIPSEIAKVIQSYHDKYEHKIIKTVVDEGGLGLSIAEEWRRRYLLAVTPAKKSDKRLFIDEVNGMFIEGKIKIHAGNDDLISELRTLVWLDSSRRFENPACENHLTDACLYSLKEVRAYLYTPPLEPVDPVKAQEDALLKAHEQRLEDIHGGWV